MVEVLPEIAVFHLVPEVFVRGGDHLEIDLDIFFPSEPPELSFLDDLYELGLEIKAHVSYFVEEDRPAVRVLEYPDFDFLASVNEPASYPKSSLSRRFSVSRRSSFRETAFRPSGRCSGAPSRRGPFPSRSRP